ncbi:histidine kinase [Actinoplanes oblitus]|uniref:histidine kinase n=1 Tax=Actinoplanes oblitus TaxID=3040509 RepID=A0ABY8WPZ1_9ACTN|nr:histidine kinase [Actinoplanes oblitus]WIM99951.1 histidine kinase [Actinoplanes oblitus]
MSSALSRGIRRMLVVPSWLSELLVLTVAGLVDLMLWSTPTKLQGSGAAPIWLVPAVSAVTLPTLLLRHRLPVVVMLVQLLWASGCGVVFREYTPIMALLVALNALAQRRPPDNSLRGWVACCLPFVIYAHTGGQSTPKQITLVTLLMVLAGTAWLVGYRARRTEQRIAEREAATVVALRAERLRIARELHDIVAHAVNVMVLQSAGARAVLASDPSRAEAALDVVQDVGRQSMNELRRLLGLLRSVDDDVSVNDPQHGLADIDGLLVNAEATGLIVSKKVSGTPQLLDPSVGLAAYRLVQEAVTNTIKHAGSRATIRVGLRWEKEHLTVTVQNETPGNTTRIPDAQPLSTGHGLLGLRERVQTVGGSLHTGPTDTGFRVQAVLPTAQQQTAGVTSGSPTLMAERMYH